MNGKLFAAAHGLIEKDGLYLVTKRASGTKYMPGKWDIPGGTVEWAESPEEALLREIDEETKIQVTVSRPILIHNNLIQLPHRQTLQIVYSCVYTGGDVVLHAREHTEFLWASAEEIRELECINFLDYLLETENL